MSSTSKHILVTGGAGFIGSHLCDELLDKDYRVTTIDNFDNFYLRSFKEDNISEAQKNSNFRLIEGDIRDDSVYAELRSEKFDAIVHLAAKAGVRPSIIDPIGYQDVNVNGTMKLLEFAKEQGIKQFVFASSSSVYGVNENVPWSEADHVLLPISPYAGTKVTGELMGHVYSKLHGIRFVALRFFTVIGPRQRPDLAIHKFSQLMLDGKSIPVFGDGETRRDYTYVKDTVQGIISAINYKNADYAIFNLGNNQTISLSEMIHTIAKALAIEPKIEQLAEQPGDVPQTWADISEANKELNYSPATPFKTGVENFAFWLKQKKHLSEDVKTV